MKSALTIAGIDRKAYAIGGAGAWRTFALVKRHIKLAWLGIESFHGVLADEDANGQERTEAPMHAGEQRDPLFGCLGSRYGDANESD